MWWTLKSKKSKRANRERSSAAVTDHTRAALDALLRKDKPAREAAINALVENTVTITVAGKVATGHASETFDVGAVIPVTAEQATSLRAQGFAK